MMTSDPFWFDDVSVLFAKERMNELVPSVSLSPDEKLNAVSRAIVFSVAAVSLIQGHTKYVVVALLMLGLIVLVQRLYTQTYAPRRRAFYQQRQQLVGGGIRQPTADNPVMNPMITEIGTSTGRAADINDPEVANKVSAELTKGLYHDHDDIWNGGASMERQFYTVPSSTFPNDQRNFAEWLYGGNERKTLKQSVHDEPYLMFDA